MLYQNIFKTLTKFTFCVIRKDYINILWRQIIFKTTTCTELVESCGIKVKKNIKMILNESFLQQLPDVKLLTWFQLLTGNNIPLLVSRDVCVSSAIKSFGRQTLNTTDFYVASCRLLSITPLTVLLAATRSGARTTSYLGL